MKKQGILQARLAGLIASLGHKDTFLIGDAGMPIPKGVECIDLAVTAGLPEFLPVLDAVLSEVCVEGITLAEEIKTENKRLHTEICGRFPKLVPEYVPHTKLKEMSAGCRFAIRTGEFSPYPNLLLRAGVVF